MSESTIVTPSKKGYVASAAMSFMGMVAAVPVMMALFSTNAPAGASPNNGAGSNYDQFAYAYTQGYLASTASSSADVCEDSSLLPVGGMGSVGGATSAGAAATTVSATHVAPGHHNVAVNVRPVGGSGNAGGSGNVSPQELARIIRDSYNTYTYVKNNTYTNSNNSIGSHNTTSTEVVVSDSRDVDIDTENDSEISNEVQNIAISDSFNKDSHDTTTTTTNTVITVDDSFNHDSGNTVVEDSNNTVTEVENTTINHTEDSFNTDNSHQDNSTTTNELDVEVEIDDSFNHQPGVMPVLSEVEA